MRYFYHFAICNLLERVRTISWWVKVKLSLQNSAEFISKMKCNTGKQFIMYNTLNYSRNQFLPVFAI